jgi:hypothetical protein
LKAAFFGALLTAGLTLASSAAAQVTPTGPSSNRLNVVFTGTVTNDVTNAIRIRQPDGTTSLYQGPVPEFPYQRGDTVKISFATDVPNRNFYSSPAYTGQVAADGIYRIAVTSPVTGTPPSRPGYTGAVDISGPISTESRLGAGPVALRGLTIVYDSNADTYSLELPTGGWLLAPLDSPTYTYDANTGTLTPRSNACIGPQCESSGIILRGTADGATIGQFSGQGIPIANASEPTVAGFMDAIGLSGMFNFPIFGRGGGGGPIDVPEPSMLLLFGAGAAAVIRRRRKIAA